MNAFELRGLDADYSLDDMRGDAGGESLQSSRRIESDRDYLVPIALPFSLPTPMYGAMLAIWHLRPVLQRRFPLHKGRVRDFVRFLAWCVSEGRRQYAILRAIPEWDASLSQPMQLPTLKGDPWASGFSVAVFLFGVARHHYTFGRLLHERSARARTALAYWRGDRHKRFLPPPAPWQLDALEASFGTVDRLVLAIQTAKVDANKGASPDVEQLGLNDVVAYFEGDRAALPETAPRSQVVALPGGIRRLPIRLPLRALRYLSWGLDRLKGRPGEREIASVTGRISVMGKPWPRSGHPFGVNLFGYARGEIGIGEDVRLVALALQAHGIPFCVVNVQPGANVSQLDSSVDRWITDEPRYAVNIFSITGIELARYACERGLDVFRGRYTIGFWPWELPDWPASCRHAYSVVDEIWGISRYTANAYRDAPRPVRAMSLPVLIDRVGDLGRTDFGLPNDHYLFVFAFDLNSTLTRKNPEATIRAFQRAFPVGRREKVGLVIKASHSDSAKGNQWLHVKAMVNADPRIHLVDATLRKPEVIALYNCCDCFVSLHRAEGFGRGIAEALLLGKQVIATAFSGNLDFCTDARVGLVRYKMKRLKRSDYFHGEGQEWADPDIVHAAELMREIRANPRDITNPDFDFSPSAVGERYVRRLREIQELLIQEGSPSC